MDVIEIKNVSKSFKIYMDKGSTLKEKLIFSKRRNYELRRVLDNISMTVKKGEVVGLVGQNGCGKSTLLKLMTKIIYPNSGTITVRGRVSSLIELGAGFHPDLSGRENIYTNASIFGLKKSEIDQRLDKIIEFSELEDFIDNPVRTYSSGMYMRLAFSVAINVDADILLIDEILAVGDTNFQAKCFERLRELKGSGMTIVIVTHDTATIERFCDRALWIESGHIQIDGRPSQVIDAYLSHMNEKRIDAINLKHQREEAKKQEEQDAEETNITACESTGDVLEDKPHSLPVEDVVESVEEKNNSAEIVDKSAAEIDYSAKRFGLRYIEITKAVLRNEDGADTAVLRCGEKCEIEIHYRVHKPLPEYVFGVGFYTLDGLNIYGNNTQLDRLEISHTKSEGIVRYKMESLPLLAGTYVLNVAVVDENGTPMDFFRDYSHFTVVSEDRSSGLFTVKHKWEVE